jgi:predicted HAD superfamily Cof-like phosphohydrolase
VADVIETDYSTNPPTVTERDFTPEELAQLEADRVAAEQAAQAAADKAAADKAARDAAIAHAKSLGFTDAMIDVMYPNLTMEA